MATAKFRLTTLGALRNCNFRNTYSVVQKLLYCTTSSKNEETSAVQTSGFAKFSEKQEEILKPKPENSELKKESFASLLRNSAFIDLGDPEGKVVIGTIFHVVENDLYIDFGWKFHTVCSRPVKNKGLFVRGTKVRLAIKELEMATTFLGSDKEITLLESDCILLGLANKKFLQPGQIETKVIESEFLKEI